MSEYGRYAKPLRGARDGLSERAKIKRLTMQKRKKEYLAEQAA